MKLQPARLLPAKHGCYYLYGEDRDAIFEAAEQLLAWQAEEAQLLRVDVGELDRIELESKHQGLFGTIRCHAMVRNAASANPKQCEHLLRLTASPNENMRLIICAAGIETRKALHKRMLEQSHVACAFFARPSPEEFSNWLRTQLKESGLRISPEAEMMLSNHLHGMRGAAYQAVERMRLYDNGAGNALDIETVGDLLGERSPEELGAYCAAVAGRSPRAISILHRLLYEQQLSCVQVLGWLSTRLQQLLLYQWHAQKNESTAVSRARVFGEARKRVAADARKWRSAELIQALARMLQAEILLKGASVEDKPVVLERLTLQLLRRQSEA